ncbi:hypothetical protein GCM10018772_28390 [Streptomyces fumanus]|uniref:Uncharacterized protein n=1 Tax=Streptomyces fumanus TaxID=67302 RepID=A0A919AGM1_9ACTN|nr:hypothetical protein GCM10018772_28390 [Streptomyces fumanus]
MPAGAVQRDGEVQRGKGSRGHGDAFLEVREKPSADPCGSMRIHEGSAGPRAGTAEARVRSRRSARTGVRAGVSGATERAGHALEVDVGPGVQVHHVGCPGHVGHLPRQGAGRASHISS